MESLASKQIALIGPTASGKSALSLELASRFDGIILSLDSLALYRHIDIASAKPTPQERRDIPHYGIDLIDPDHPFDVTEFAKLYREVRRRTLAENRPLLIVGGSSFYLKILLEGISPLPEISPEVRQEADALLRKPERAREMLISSAPRFASKLAAADRYRIEKGLLILLQTGMDPIDYFQMNPPEPVIEEPLPLFEIHMERTDLRHRIHRRTDAMLASGLIDEVAALEATYGRSPQSMKAIGIVEVLDYFDGRLDRKTLREKIVTDTARLAKRQTSFNRSQFSGVVRGERERLKKLIASLLGKQSGFSSR